MKKYIKPSIRIIALHQRPVLSSASPYGNYNSLRGNSMSTPGVSNSYDDSYNDDEYY